MMIDEMMRYILQGIDINDYASSESLSRLMQAPMVAFVILHWIEYCTASDEMSDITAIHTSNMLVEISFSAYLNYVPLFYELIVQASLYDSTQQPAKKATHPYTFKVLSSVLSKLMNSNTATFDSELMENNNELVQKLVRDGCECLIYLMSLGYALAPLQFIIDSIESLDADVVRFIVANLLSSIKQPFSVIFLTKLHELLTRDSVSKALAKKENFNLLLQFEQEVLKGLASSSIDALLGDAEDDEDQASLKYQEIASKIQSLVIKCKSTFKY
jgi:hypothetical protein